MAAASKPASGSRTIFAAHARKYTTTSRSLDSNNAGGILPKFRASARYALRAAADTLPSPRRKLASGGCSKLVLRTNGAASKARLSKKARGRTLRMLCRACWGGGAGAPGKFCLHALRIVRSGRVEQQFIWRVGVVGALELQGTSVD